MGRWTTLHLFDDELFFKETVPILKGEKGGIKKLFSEFLKYYYSININRNSEPEMEEFIDYSVEFILKQSQDFDETFSMHSIYGKNPSLSYNFYNPVNVDKRDLRWDYDYFFCYLIFSTCADFYPHITTHKSGIIFPGVCSVRVDYQGLIARENSFFDSNYGPILGWLTHKELKDLMSMKTFRIENDTDIEYMSDFLKFALDNNLGVIQGGDLNEDQLGTLPSYKLVNEEKWKLYKNFIFHNYRVISKR